MSGRARIALSAALVSCLAVLPGCGRKAPNLPPADSAYPRTYPAPHSPETAPPATAPPNAPTVDERRRVTAPPS